MASCLFLSAEIGRMHSRIGREHRCGSFHHHPLRAGTLVWSDRQDGITWRIHERSSRGPAWWMWLEV